MAFSDKLREALGGQGVRVRAELAEERVAPGKTARVKIRAVGGTVPADVTGCTVHLIRAVRRWVGPDGREVPESDAVALVDRSHLQVQWDRSIVATTRAEVSEHLAPGTETSWNVDFVLPMEAEPTAPGLVYTIHVQADVPGQIDPTANVRVQVA